MNTEIEQLFFDICNLEKKKKKIRDYKDCKRGYNFYDNIQEYLEIIKKIHDKINKIIYSKD